MPRPRLIPAAALLAAAVILPACLDRQETIRVNPDASVNLTSVFKGDAGDVNSGDPLPAPGKSAWVVQDEEDRAQDGKVNLLRTATLTIAPGQALPDSYAAPGDPHGTTALHFPTTLTVERRADGATYYHFKRTYLRRDDATYTWLRRSMEEDPSLKSLSDRDPATMTEGDRSRLISALRTLEVDKQLHFVDAGAAAALAGQPQDLALAVRRAVVEFGSTFPTDAIAKLLAQPESAQRDASIDAIAKRFVAGARQAAAEALAKLPVADPARAAFLAAFDQEADRRAITEDLSDEHWTVSVEMPGQIIAHNADSVDGSTAEWEFPAAAIMDRDQVLEVTSRVGPAPAKNPPSR